MTTISKIFIQWLVEWHFKKHSKEWQKCERKAMAYLTLAFDVHKSPMYNVRHLKIEFDLMYI